MSHPITERMLKDGAHAIPSDKAVQKEITEKINAAAVELEKVILPDLLMGFNDALLQTLIIIATHCKISMSDIVESALMDSLRQGTLNTLATTIEEVIKGTPSSEGVTLQ